MTDKDKALSLEQTLRLALEALELCINQGMIPMYLNKNKDAITAIKAALSGEAQTRSVVKDEPVVWNEGVPAMLPKQKEGETFIVSYEPKLEAKDEQQPTEQWAATSAMDAIPSSIEAVPASLKLQAEIEAMMLTTVKKQRTWVGLTDEEKIIMSRYDLEYAALIGEVERKLKEKNGYA